MYYTHNLRSNLQEWKNRLLKSSHSQFATQFQYFLKNIESEPILIGLIEEACTMYSIDEVFAKKWIEKYDYEFIFDDEGKQAACFYHVSKYIVKTYGAKNIVHMNFLYGEVEEKRDKYVETFVTPLVDYLHDRIDQSNSILFLLEKYKKRVEWFKREELYNSYQNAVSKRYEQVLEDDLRLFLFDQGINYPFSTPQSFSGRADIVGMIDTQNPLIAEIKVYDSGKGYRKERIISGFSQIFKYTNDYNKDFGYLVIFNLDDTEIVFNFTQEQKNFPPRLTVNNKTYYFVVVNLFFNYTASTIGKTKTVEISEIELLKAIEA